MSEEEVLEKKSGWIEFLHWVEAILIAVVAAVFIRTFIFEPVLVQGSSMEDTLHSEERLILYKLGFRFKDPCRGDIIVLKYREGKSNIFSLFNRSKFNYGILGQQEIDYIKRVIAVPGDTIDIREGKVYINGKELVEPYVKGKTMPKGMKFPIKIKEGYYFVMGDNRQYSSDSRSIGLIKRDRIKGKAVLRYWPIKLFGSIYR